MKNSINKFEDSRVKIQVFEREDGKYISTHWDKTRELENDRFVQVFETYGGAIDQAFRWLSNICKEEMMYKNKGEKGEH